MAHHGNSCTGDVDFRSRSGVRRASHPIGGSRGDDVYRSVDHRGPSNEKKM